MSSREATLQNEDLVYKCLFHGIAFSCLNINIYLCRDRFPWIRLVHAICLSADPALTRDEKSCTSDYFMLSAYAIGPLAKAEKKLMQNL